MSETTTPEDKFAYTPEGVPFYAYWGDGSLPMPDLTKEGFHGLEWTLRYGQDHITREELMRAAAIVSAYGDLIFMTERKRSRVAGRLKRAALAWLNSDQS